MKQITTPVAFQSCVSILTCVWGVRSVFKCFILSNPEFEDFKLHSRPTGSFEINLFIFTIRY